MALIQNKPLINGWKHKVKSFQYLKAKGKNRRGASWHEFVVNEIESGELKGLEDNSITFARVVFLS